MFSKIMTAISGSALVFGLATGSAFVAPTAAVSGPLPAAAQCSTIAGVNVRDGIVVIAAQPGQVIQVVADPANIGGARVDVSINNAPSVETFVPATINVVTAGTIVIEQRMNGALVTCSSNTGSGFIDTQTSAVQTATSRNTQARLNGNGPRNSASRNSVFLSTSNLPGADSQLGQAEFNGWVSVEGRQLSGATTGNTFDVVFGVDRLISNRLIVGALIAYGRQDLTSGTTNTQVNSPSVGAYFASRLQGDWLADGYVSVARPAYDVGGATFTANRVSGAFGLTGNYDAYGMGMSPFAKVNGYRESQPAYGAVAANDITRFNASVGTRVSPLAELDGGILPYISVAVDFGVTDSTAGGRDSYWAPRLGAGFSTELGAGFLSVDMDAGRIRSDVTDIGLRATYEFTF